jgi:hypothetical protein
VHIFNVAEASSLRDCSRSVSLRESIRSVIASWKYPKRPRFAEYNLPIKKPIQIKLRFIFSGITNALNILDSAIVINKKSGVIINWQNEGIFRNFRISDPG